MMRLNGEFVPVDPQSWNASMDLMTNVGLGTGQKEQKIAALMQTMQDQSAIWQAYGPSNPFVTLTHMHNVRAELLSLAGVHDVTSYYNPMNPQIEAQYWQAMQAQAQQAAQNPPQPDPYIQGEQIKAQVRLQEMQAKAALDKEKAQANYVRDMTKQAMDDDLKRDELAQKRALEAAKLEAEYAYRVNQQAIQAEQAAPRNFGPQG
jgi:hypothetical protein